jgi:hypothetical protein
VILKAGKRLSTRLQYNNVQSLCTVFVKMPTGKTVKVKVSHPFNVEDVKLGILVEEYIPPCAQRLTYNGSVLEDGVALVVYNVQNGSDLELTLLGSKYIYSI